jgi:hypothetical protein
MALPAFLTSFHIAQCRVVGILYEDAILIREEPIPARLAEQEHPWAIVAAAARLKAARTRNISNEGGKLRPLASNRFAPFKKVALSAIMTNIQR